MRTPQNELSIQVGVELRESKFCALLAALLLGLSLSSTAVSAQGISQGTPQSQVESAARSRVPRTPNSARGANGSEGQAPSTQPRVLFEDGQLTINAFDSSLADVLYALRASTGADIDLPSGASSERVTAQLGPGPARKVLADLLSWSNFDYVIQASDNDPLSIQSVTLMVRIKSSPSAAPAAPGRAAAVVARPADPTPAPAPAEVPEVENHAEAPVANNNGNSNANAADSLSPQTQLSPQPSQAKGTDMTPAGSSSGKSPADMIQELQQMYQQRRTLQEQQNRGGMPPQATSQ
jgi:hypothetical protein